MTFPVSIVEIDFDNGPLSATSTWTDVTADVCGAVQWAYGKKRAVGEFVPGRGSIQLLNLDRKYDPGYSGSPHNGDLIPRRKIRGRWRAPSVVTTDDFSDLPGGWTVTAGLWQADVFGAYFTVASAEVYRDFGATDVQFEYSEEYNGDVGGAVLRWADESNNIRLYYTQTVAYLQYNIGAGYVQIAAFAIPTINIGTTHVWRITLEGNDIEIELDSVVEYTGSVAAASPLLGNTSHGFRTTAAGNNRWSNLTVTELPEPGYSPAFYGYIDDWMPDYGAGICTVPFSDGLGLLAAERMDGSVLKSEIESRTALLAWWRFNEPTGTTVCDWSGNRHNASLLKLVDLGEAPVGIGEYWPHAEDAAAGDAIRFKGPNPAQYSEMPGWDVGEAAAQAGLTTGEPWTMPRFPFLPVPTAARVDDVWSIEMWVRCAPAWQIDADGDFERTGIGYTMLWSNGVDSTAAPILQLRSLPHNPLGSLGLHLVSYDGPNPTVLAQTNISIEDDEPHHIVLTSEISGGTDRIYRIYIDSGFHGLSATTPHYASTSDPQHFFYPDNVSWFNGVVGEIAIYNHTMTAGDVGENFAAGNAPLMGQASGARVTEILDRGGWPAGRRNIDPGYIQLGPLDLRGAKALGLLAESARADAGAIFQEPGGDIRYRAKRYHTIDAISTTAQASIDDTTPGATRLRPLRTPEYGTAIDSIVNVATVRSDWLGFEWKVNEVTSIASYGEREESVVSNARFTTDIEGLAGWLTVQYATPEHAPRKVKFAPTTDLEIGTAVKLTVGSLVQVAVTPVGGVGSQMSHFAIVQGVRVNMGPGSDLFEMELDLHPVPQGSAW